MSLVCYENRPSIVSPWGRQIPPPGAIAPGGGICGANVWTAADFPKGENLACNILGFFVYEHLLTQSIVLRVIESTSRFVNKIINKPELFWLSIPICTQQR